MSSHNAFDNAARAIESIVVNVTEMRMATTERKKIGMQLRENNEVTAACTCIPHRPLQLRRALRIPDERSYEHRALQGTA